MVQNMRTTEGIARMFSLNFQKYSTTKTILPPFQKGKDSTKLKKFFTTNSEVMQ